MSLSTRTTAPSTEAIAKALAPILPPGYQAVIFGSRASGQQRAGSDWDVGVLGPEPLDGALMETLREALEELPTLHSFDLVDLSTVPTVFRELALRTAVRIL